MLVCFLVRGLVFFLVGFCRSAGCGAVLAGWRRLGSQYWNSNDSSISALQSTAAGPVTPKAKEHSNGTPNVSSGIIPYLERHTTNEFLLRGRAYTLQRIIKMVLSRDGFENFESSVSIAHLENRIAGAMQLGSQDEFRLYLFMYAKRLGAEGLRGKVEELLNSLIGGILRGKKSGDKSEHQQVAGAEFGKAKGWFSVEGDICGWDRMELLKGVVMILGMFAYPFARSFGSDLVVEVYRLLTTCWYRQVSGASAVDGSICQDVGSYR